MPSSLKFSYTLLSPLYDHLIESASRPLRQRSLQALTRMDLAQAKILIDGIGSGLDIPWLPIGPQYTGIDLTPAMLRRAQLRRVLRRDTELQFDIQLQEGDAHALPFDAASFDAVVMHLILAVVPNPVLALQEAQRVLKPAGYILILDKFLRPGQLALLRRLISPLAGRLASRTDVVFEEVLRQSPQLEITMDEPALAKGWFRYILLQKR